MTPEEQQRWMAQWRRAAVALDEVRTRELREMSDEEAARAADAVMDLSASAGPPAYLLTSGLVEQQRLFMKALNK